MHSNGPPSAAATDADADAATQCGYTLNWNETGLCTGHNTGRWNHPTQVYSLQKREECMAGSDSSILLSQTLLCSGIIFASKSRTPKYESPN